MITLQKYLHLIENDDADLCCRQNDERLCFILYSQTYVFFLSQSRLCELFLEAIKYSW